MNTKIIIRLLVTISVLWLISSCKKYLDTKSNQTLATPQTLDDLDAILKNPTMNLAMAMTNGSSDEYYLKYTDWNSIADLQKYGYIWAAADLNDIFDWQQAYQTVLYSNTVLDQLEKMPSKNQERKWNNIKGRALFFRAYAFFEIAQLFAPQYDPSTATTDLGIPLRLNSNFNDPSNRSTVQETYDRIVNDLQNALPLLPSDLPITILGKTQPTRVALYGLLARVYLQMGNYSLAKQNADNCLQLYNKLLDFNQPPVDLLSSNPIPQFNDEVIYYTNTSAPVNSNSIAKIDSNLFQSYTSNDIRQVAYFSKNTDNTYRFKGSYNSGSTDLFNGIATDEIYLIRAEANARLKDVTDALRDLDTLLIRRIETGSFVPSSASNPDQALSLILTERRKELVYRGLRWSDLKRLNKDSRFAITLTRNLNAQLYNLPPNDPRYNLLIPLEVITQSSLQQNPR
jgi:starch-binding outer membrane protein, SusD/RagB family